MAKLTKKAIESFPPGTDLDLLIATTLMEWKTITEDADQPNEVPYYISGTGRAFYPSIASQFPDLYPQQGLPPFSTHIAAAFLLAEKLRPLQLQLFAPITNEGWWIAKFMCHQTARLVVSGGEQAPLAIARAALLTSKEAEFG